MIVTSDRPVGLAGGSPDGARDLVRVAPLVGDWVGADGGADLLRDAGVTPAAVIGDMDSASPAARAQFADLIHHIPEQNSTDFDKALRNISAPAIVAVGFMGGRIDHELAVMNTLVRRPGVIALGRGSAVMALTGRVVLDLPAGTLVSLFPLAHVAVRSEGLRWPTGGIGFAPDGRVGTSNEATGGRMMLDPAGPGMLLIVPDSYLEPLLDAARAGREEGSAKGDRS